MLTENLIEASNPFKKQEAKILNLQEDGTVTLKIENPFLLLNYDSVIIYPIDKRKITEKQRKMVWSLIGDIAEWMGESKSSASKSLINEAMKINFMHSSNEDYEKLFSLSNAPVSLVLEYQKFLISFIIENDIPTKEPLYNNVINFSDYIYQCLCNKKCCICGQKSDLHHCNIDNSRVGMGRNRNTIIHEGLSVLPLCRKHHTEIHTVPEKEFFNKYHIDGPVKMDKHLCELYGVKYFVT